MTSKEKCPKCGEEVLFGYGLAGGGIGMHKACSNAECDYFDKKHDDEEKPTE